MPALKCKVEFDVRCFKCGRDLSSEVSTYLDRWGAEHLFIDPCPDCLSGADATGYDLGKADAEVDEWLAQCEGSLSRGHIGAQDRCGRIGAQER